MTEAAQLFVGGLALITLGACAHFGAIYANDESGGRWSWLLHFFWGAGSVFVVLVGGSWAIVLVAKILGAWILNLGVS